MTDEVQDARTTDALTDEEVAEAIRARKARSRWGGVMALAGVLGFVVIAFLLLLRKQPVGAEELGILGMFFAMGCVGAGYADPSDLPGFRK